MPLQRFELLAGNLHSVDGEGLDGDRVTATHAGARFSTPRSIFAPAVVAFIVALKAMNRALFALFVFAEWA